MSYTPFTLDNELVRKPDHEWIAFLAGTGLPWPAPEAMIFSSCPTKCTRHMERKS